MNCGELGSTPLPALTASRIEPPMKTGSGKLGTPWERIHAEYFNASACACGPTVPFAAWASGDSALHAASAATNCGELGSRSDPGVDVMSNPPLTGSGKSGTPCARMHCAYFAASGVAAAPAGADDAPVEAA